MSKVKQAVETKATKQSPICPSCKKPLVRVWETIYETYVFDPETGTYTTNDWNDEMTIKCPECQTDISDILEDGACNFNLDEYEKSIASTGQEHEDVTHEQ